jgi:hypothetical protein
MKLSFRLSLVLLVCWMLACGGALIRVPNGYLRTPGSTIAAEDRSFEIKTGREFKTPFFMECVSVGIDFWNIKGKDIKSLYKNALSCGGKKVIVHVPYRSNPLYGVLGFVPLPSDASGPGARSFEISIPESYAQAATGGRISVIYELVNNKSISWVLWLSDQPFDTTGK